MPMTPRAGLQVDEDLAAFIERDVLPGLDLAADAAGAQARDVGVQLGRGVEIDGQIDGVGIVAVLLAQRPRQVVVPVDQRRPLQYPPRRRLVLGHGRNRGHQDGGGGKQDGADHDGLPEKTTPDSGRAGRRVKAEDLTSPFAKANGEDRSARQRRSGGGGAGGRRLAHHWLTPAPPPPGRCFASTCPPHRPSPMGR